MTTPESISTIRQLFQSYSKNPDKATLGKLRLEVAAWREGPAVASRLAGALDAVLGDLADNPSRSTLSVMRTVAQAIDLLGLLAAVPVDDALTLSKVNALAVDDDNVALRTVQAALEKALFLATCVNDPAAALKHAQQQPFDLVVCDIMMPGMTGLELCAKLRALPQCRTTPVVFVTSADDFDNRAQAVLSGGSDLIAKPFLLSELTLKALILVLNARRTA